MTATIRRRRSRTAPSSEALAGARAGIAKVTSLYRDGGLRVDWDKLDEAEQTALIKLLYEASEGGGFSLDRLGKRQKDFERLVEKGADAAGIFKNARTEEEIRKLAADAHALTVKRPLRRREELSLFAAMAAALGNGHFWWEHFAVLTAIVAQWVTGRPLAPQSVVDRVDGVPVLRINASFGIVSGRSDPEGRLAAWKQAMPHLEQYGWLVVERASNQWTIKPGPRLIAALAALDSKMKDAA
jgi:hypothetical protein